MISVDTSQRILDIAERLVQTRGFNGFSYADIAATLGVTKASLHYHFPSKADLGQRLIERYETNFLATLASIDRAGGSAFDRLQRYVAVYTDVLRNDRMCLCGMLAAEFATLPPPMRDEMKHFFDENERWLSGVLEHGAARGEIRFAEHARDVARALMASLEGAMMLARSYGDVARFEFAAHRALAQLSA